MCFSHGTVGRFLVHTWVNAEPVPRFYPNVVSLTTGAADIDEQRQIVDMLLKSNLPSRWAVKDSFRTLDIARLGFDSNLVHVLPLTNSKCVSLQFQLFVSPR